MAQAAESNSSSSSGATSLHMEAYRVVPLGGPLPHRIESITTLRSLVLVGTHDSRIIAYRASTTRGTAATLTLLQEVVDPRRHAVRLLTVVGGRRLLALVGDAVAVYHVHDEPGAAFQLREVTALVGLKDTVDFHVKQHKGVVTVAVLQRKRVTLYEASHANLDFLLKEAIALPDGVRTLCWVGRSLMLGGRKDYLLYHPSSASTAALYATPRTGTPPVVLPMAPVPEVLVAVDGAGLRALLSDGSAVPGASRVQWATTPAEMCYEHPYVVSHHPAAPHEALQVRLPLLTTLDADAAAYLRTCLCQSIDLARVARLSQSRWTDYDSAMPARAAPAEALAQHPIVVADAEHRLYLLARSPVAAQAEALAAHHLFAAADLLCRLCPHEVPVPTLRRLVTAGAVHKFTVLQDYAGCFHDLAGVESDPRVALQLFPGYLRPSEGPGEDPALPTAAPSTVTAAALPALADYLQAQRATLLVLRHGGGGADSAGVAEPALLRLRAVDRGLVLALCAMGQEDALLALVRGDNACEVDDAAAVLREHEHWVALTVLLEAHGRYEEAAAQLGRLATAAPSSAAASIAAALGRLVAEHAQVAPSDEAYVPQLALAAWLAESPAGAALSPAAAASVAAVVTGLRFFRRRPLATCARLFEAHAAWLLGLAPPECAVRAFFAADNVAEYAAALQVLESYAPPSGATPRLLLLVEYLSRLLADPSVHVTEEAVHEQYWRGLGELLFTTNSAAAAVAPGTADHRRYRDRLDEVLLTSPHIDLTAADTYFNAAEVRGRCMPERAAVYRRQGNHRAAAVMFVHEAGSLADAQAYAGSVQHEGSSAAFTALLELLLRPAEGPPRLHDALEVMQRSDGIDAAAVLPMLPDDVPFAQVSGFVLNSLRTATSASRAAAVHCGILAARERRGSEGAVRLASRSVVVEDRMVCAVCQRRLRPDTVLAVFPNNVVVHQGCAADEHVCPATRRDFRHDAYAALEDL